MPSLSIDWFGAGVRIESNNRAFLRHLQTCLPTRPDAYAGARPLSYAFRAAPPRTPRLVRRREVLDLDPREPEEHAGRLLLADLLGRTGGLFVLHGIALVRAGAALVVSAPSGFGKTTLAVHLAQRGFTLLTDDLIGLDRTTGVVLPFAKALALRPGTRKALPARLGARARRARTAPAARGGEWLVDPVAFLGGLAPPAPPTTIVVVRPPGPRSRPRRLGVMELRFAPGRAPLPETLRSIPGVEEAGAAPGAPNVIHVRFSEGAGLDRYLRRHRTTIMLACKRPSTGPRFDRPPRIWPIGPFQAAMELGQEMVNRGHGSNLEREFRGREGHLVVELASLLRDCRCYAMTPGRLDTTLGMLQRRFAAGRA